MQQRTVQKLARILNFANQQTHTHTLDIHFVSESNGANNLTQSVHPSNKFAKIKRIMHLLSHRCTACRGGRRRNLSHNRCNLSGRSHQSRTRGCVHVHSPTWTHVCFMEYLLDCIEDRRRSRRKSLNNFAVLFVLCTWWDDYSYGSSSSAFG